MNERFSLRYGIRSVLFAFFLPAFLIATASGLRAETAVVAQAAKSCLWTVSSRSNKIYLMGSLHVLKKDAYPLDAALERAYSDSQNIIFETDIAAMHEPEMQARLLELGLYPPEQNLFQRLDSDTRQLLEKKMSEIGLPLEQFSRFKPWFVAVTLATAELQRLGYNPAFGVDVYFFNRAKADGKEIGFLEPAEFQIELLGRMEAQDQNDFLSQTLKDLEVVSQLAGDLVKSWKAGESDRLHDILSKSFEDYPALHDRLLIQRNNKWIAAIEGALRKNENTLFVVGAGHLVGPESVVDLLKKKGYPVNQQ